VDRRLALPLLVALIAAAVLWSTVRSRGGSEPAAPAALTGQRGAPAASIELARAAPAHSARSSVPSGAPVIAPAAEAALIVDVWTRTPGFGAFRQSVPSVPFVVGVGAPLDPAVRPLTRAVSDADGRARVTIPWSAVEAVRESPGAAVWARVTGQGLRARTKWTELPPAPGVLELALLVSPGGTVRGRLLAGPDQPVPGKVRLYKRNKRGRLGFGGGYGGDAGEDGWFAVHLTKAGIYQVLADAGEHGTAALRDYEVRFGGEREPVELLVQGSGIVRGRVRDAAGRPAAMLDVLVLLASLGEPNGSYGLPEPQASERRLEGRGQFQASSRTDAQGAFEFLGLRADPYVVRARTDPYGSGYPYLLTRAPVPSDGVALQLSFGRPHLAVSVVNEDGSPWTTPLRVPARRDTDPGAVWPARPQLSVFPASDEAHLLGPYETRLFGRAGAGGETVFEVDDGRRYQVGLLGGAMPWRPVEASVPEGASRVEVTVTAPEAGAMGALVVVVYDAQGAAVERGLVIRVEDLDTGAPLLVRNSIFRATGPYRINLPEGQYRLIVEGAASIERQHGTLMSERKHGRFVTTVRVLESRETTVNATLSQGARLRVRLAGSVGEQDREALREQHPDWDADVIEYRIGRAAFALLAEGRWPEPILFRWEVTQSSAAGTHLTSELALGSEQTSELLPAGRFRVEARLPGGRVVSRSVVLVEGETTAIDLSFE